MYSDQFNPSYLSNKRYAQSEIFRGLMFHDVQLFTAKIDSNFDVHETVLGLFLRSFFTKSIDDSFIYKNNVKNILLQRVRTDQPCIFLTVFYIIRALVIYI